MNALLAGLLAVPALVLGAPARPSRSTAPT